MDTQAPAKKTRASTRTVPAKQHKPGKISSHFAHAKTAIEVFQDGKDDDDALAPSTPRHRDALSKKIPVTPRHRVRLTGSQLTPRTPQTPLTSASVYNQARRLFSRCSNPGRLVGRDRERQEISNYVQTCLDSKLTGCLYVSGPPGTGKSALIGEATQQYLEDESMRMSTINCMSVRNTKDLSQKLSEDLGLKEDAGFDHLRSCFIGGKAQDSKKYLVILDEVDRLVDLDLELLYGLFEWSLHPTSRLILIGIANALDLTDRFLPRLKSRNLSPELLPFMPYTAAQIAEVLTAKLKSLGTSESTTVPFLHPTAIQFCAKKVAGQTGDLRKAFDICRRAIDLAEQEDTEKNAQLALQASPSKTPLMENINLSSPVTPRSPMDKPRPLIAYTLETAPKATIAHMARVTAQVFGNGTIQRLAVLNLQQKAVLCALSALEKRKRHTQVERSMFSTPSKTGLHSAPTLKQLFEAYSRLCKRENLLHPLSSVEFRDVVSGLEGVSLISPADGKNGSFAMPVTPSRTPGKRGRRSAFGVGILGDERRVAGVVGFKELSTSLDGAGAELLREILEGDGDF